MKRYNNIYDNITDIDNIRSAINHAAKGKTKRENVIKILDNIDYYALEIQKMLQDFSYVPSPYNKVKIFDGARKKERYIYKPRFYPDQCIHWALMLQIEKILSKRMYKWSCASIKKRGTHYAGDKLKKILRQDKRNTKYCVQLDIHHFYQSINQEILKDRLRKLFKDKGVIWLLDQIINSAEEGVPIGNYTSQWFANFYLTELDYFIKQELKVKHYIRYMDDVILFGSNKRMLRNTMREIEEYLNTKLKLELKPNYQLFKTDSRPIDFIGFRFYRNHTTIRDSLSLRIRRRVKKIHKKQVLNLHDACSIVSYYGWVTHTNSYNYYNKHIKKYITLKQCKEVIRNG